MSRSLPRPSRRVLLGGLAALGLPVVAPAHAGEPPLDLLGGPASLLRSPRHAARVGRAYLRLVPEERDKARLLALIAEQVSEFGRAPDRRADPEALRRAVALSVQDDFAHGRVARVQGWVLARTEARLAALVALG